MFVRGFGGDAETLFGSDIVDMGMGATIINVEQNWSPRFSSLTGVYFVVAFQLQKQKEIEHEQKRKRQLFGSYRAFVT